jgi:hypothetical protein
VPDVDCFPLRARLGKRRPTVSVFGALSARVSKRFATLRSSSIKVLFPSFGLDDCADLPSVRSNAIAVPKKILQITAAIEVPRAAFFLIVSKQRKPIWQCVQLRNGTEIKAGVSSKKLHF